MTFGFQARQGIRGMAGFALSALLPPRCLACGTTVDHQGALCAGCWSGIQFLDAPLCELCGFPLEYELGAGMLCGACVRERPSFDRARAVMRYNDASRSLLLGFKHADRTEGAPAYGAWLARAGAGLIDEADLIVPVPLYWLRLFQRRYNQSALLAHALGRVSGVPVVADLLLRRRNTASQGRMKATQRRRNVAGAFAVKPARLPMLEGRRVLLVDDVLTTGATASACAQVLRSGGASGVNVMVLARVVRPQI